MVIQADLLYPLPAVPLRRGILSVREYRVWIILNGRPPLGTDGATHLFLSRPTGPCGNGRTLCPSTKPILLWKNRQRAESMGRCALSAWGGKICCRKEYLIWTRTAVSDFVQPTNHCVWVGIISISSHESRYLSKKQAETHNGTHCFLPQENLHADLKNRNFADPCQFPSSPLQYAHKIDSIAGPRWWEQMHLWREDKLDMRLSCGWL